MTYAKGCLSAAWSDIMNSPSWFSRVILLGLVAIVPILNFVTMGYAMRWSRQLMLGRIEPMPKQIFVPRAFVNGFFAVVIALVISLVVSICGSLLAFVPVLGALALAVLSIFSSMFQYVAIMRTAVADRLGAGFDISQIWKTFKRNMGELFCAAVLPTLIMSVIAAIIGVILFSLFAVSSLGTFANLAYYAYDSFDQALAVMQLLMSMTPVLIVFVVICSFGEAFIYLLTMRAMGHYVTRYAQEWKGEAAVMSTAYINGD